MDGFSLQTPEQVGKTLAARLKALRLARGWKQATLAERSGVSLASLRRFEASGRASLQHLLALAFALNRLDDFDALLQAPRAASLAELEAAEKQPTRRAAAAAGPSRASGSRLRPDLRALRRLKCWSQSRETRSFQGRTTCPPAIRIGSSSSPLGKTRRTPGRPSSPTP